MIQCIAVSDPNGMDSADQGVTVLYASNAQDEAELTACAAEVRVLLEGAWANIMKIGGVLKTAKEKCAYGTWGKWVEKECGFSQKTASRYMAVYDRFRENEKVLALPGSLSYALLGVPDEGDVNELAEKAVAEGWSERQLKQEIARRKEAEKRAQEAETEIERTVQTALEIENDLRAEKEKLKKKLSAANERSDAYAQNLMDARDQMEHMRSELAEARRAQAEPRIVEKSVEVYPMDYDATKERNAHLELCIDAQKGQIERLRAELEEARQAAARAAEAQEAAEKRQDPSVQVITAAQFGDTITTFLSRIADVARQQFDFMPAGMIGEYLDHVGRVERFCEDLRAVIEG